MHWHKICVKVSTTEGITKVWHATIPTSPYSWSSYWNSGTTARVWTPNDMSDAFCTTSGVRQGCLLSSAVQLTGWCDNVLAVLESMLLVSISPTSTMLMMQYFFTEDAAKWDDVLDNFKASASIMGLHTNWFKTKILELEKLQPQSTSATRQWRLHSSSPSWALM